MFPNPVIVEVTAVIYKEYIIITYNSLKLTVKLIIYIKYL